MHDIIVKPISINEIPTYKEVATVLTEEIQELCPEGYHFKEIIDCDIQKFFFDWSCNCLVIYEINKG